MNFAQRLVQLLGRHTDLEVSFKVEDGKTILDIEGGVSVKDAITKFIKPEDSEEREDGIPGGSIAPRTPSGKS